MSGYSAYILTEDKRKTLLKVFEPQFKKVIAHHITFEHGRDMPDHMPELNHVEFTHFITDGKGLETLVVKINGQDKSADGRHYHITWSLNPDEALSAPLSKLYPDAPCYLAVHSNGLIELALSDNCPDEFNVTELDCKIKGSDFKAVYVDKADNTTHIIPMKAPKLTAAEGPKRTTKSGKPKL